MFGNSKFDITWRLNRTTAICKKRRITLKVSCTSNQEQTKRGKKRKKKYNMENRFEEVERHKNFVSTEITLPSCVLQLPRELRRGFINKLGDVQSLRFPGRATKRQDANYVTRGYITYGYSYTASKTILRNVVLFYLKRVFKYILIR